MKTKVCADCKLEKPYNQFPIRKKGYPYAYCRKCSNAQNREAYKRKYNSDPAWKRKLLDRTNKWKTDNGPGWYYQVADLRKNYNMTVEEYESILNSQNGVCAICEKECLSGRNLAVDHCHETNTIRGLLCSNCNPGLGHFKDSSNLLRKAIAYLEKERI